jgi:hypothetical protein
LPCIRNDPNNSKQLYRGPSTAPKEEYRVGNNKNPNQKQPGEKEPGRFHYNPGNMSGKTAGTKKDESEPQSSADGSQGHSDPKDK